MLTRKITTTAVLCTLLLSGSGCKKKDSGSSAGVYTTIDDNMAGTITGTIHFAGKAPERIEIDMAQDPFCSAAEINYTEQYVVHDGGLASMGMPAFQEIGDEDLRAIFMYIRQQAREAASSVHDHTAAGGPNQVVSASPSPR